MTVRVAQAGTAAKSVFAFNPFSYFLRLWAKGKQGIGNDSAQ
jgi:hypothetical protein